MNKSKIDLTQISTEKDSNYNNIEKMSVIEILTNINKEDQTVATSVKKSLPQIKKLAEKCVEALQNNGRIFYIGSGTSGRLGIVDASECPPTYGVPHGMVVGLIAGGDGAIRTSVEKAEDSLTAGFKDLTKYKINKKDIVIGITASGRTPYVLGALQKCQQRSITTGCIVCSKNSVVAKNSNYPVETIVGPEFITGSTRMKAGTAQKLILNMITTTAMIKIGRVEGNKMTHMKLSNDKLVQRGIRTVMEKTKLSYTDAVKLLKNNGNDISKSLKDFRN